MRTIRVLLSALGVGVAVDGFAVLVAGFPASVACAVLLASSALIPVMVAAYALVALRRDQVRSQVRSQVGQPGVGEEFPLCTGRAVHREPALSAAG